MSTSRPDLPPGARWGPVLAEDEAPPRRPPRELLAAAAAVLAGEHAVATPSIRWSWGEPLGRRHSHLLPVAAHLPGGRRVDAWYKVVFVPRSEDGRPDEEWLDQARQGFRVARRAGDASRRLAADEAASEPPILLASVLAADDAALRLLVTSVPGRPLGRVFARPALAFALGPIFRRVGRAVRLVEELAGERPPIASTSVRRRALGTLGAALADGVLPDGARAAVESRFHRLLAETERDGAGAYVHGDLSGSNVFVRAGGGVGLIDLDWRPRPRGFDLATYSVRLQLEKPRIDPLTRRCIESMIAGYGGEIARAPGFLLERSQRWLRLLWQGTVSPRSRTGERVIAELAGGSPWLPCGCPPAAAAETPDGGRP